MNSMRSYLNLRRLPWTRSTIASARQTQAILLAALALCVAIFTATPAYGASSKAHSDSTANNQNWKIGTMMPDDPADAAGLHFDVTYRLYDLVLYNPKNCAEITAGSWANTAPIYGRVGQGYVYGHLANGDCPAYTYRFRAIYYEWTRDPSATKDHFKAYWYGAGHKSPIYTFLIKLG
jgi:hypothetical protein